MRNPASLTGDLKFMLLLATVCSILLMMARVSIGERAELSPATIDAVFSISGLEAVQDVKAAITAFNGKFVRRASGRYQWWQNIQHPDNWACEATGAGMWAEIRLVFVFDRAQQRIVGMRIVEQGETAGLGDRIAEEAFLEKFVELEAHAGIEMAVAKSRANQFDAITGATISSRAIETTVNRALKSLHLLKSESSASRESS